MLLNLAIVFERIGDGSVALRTDLAYLSWPEKSPGYGNVS